MNELLKASFSKELIELAAAIGAKADSLEDKIQQLFTSLRDPLLSRDDVHEMLGTHISGDEVGTALRSLVEKKLLESSERTLRPFDAEGTVLYRLVNFPFARLKLFAIESQLSDGSGRFQFTCDGRLIRCIARVDRLDTLAASGNQRQEIRSHVEEIAKGIKAGTQVPNSILLVLMESQVVEAADEDTPQSFIIVMPMSDWIVVGLPHEPDQLAQQFRTVELVFPFRRAAFDEEKSAWLVDGQQRTAALSFADVDEVPQFSLSVNAVRASAEEAKRVFQVANSTVKISTEFSRALLASMNDAPVYLREERDMALAVKNLALDIPGSPFFGLAQHPGFKQVPRPPIAYNSLFQVIKVFAEGSLTLDGADEIAETVRKSFEIVKATWPDAWGKKASESKLMHGAGLRAIAAVVERKLVGMLSEGDGDLNDPEVWEGLKQSLARLSARIVWTPEAMSQASTAVKKLYVEQISDRQNTNQDIQAMISFLSKEILSLDMAAKKSAKATK